jgi:hypothetical protein
VISQSELLAAVDAAFELTGRGLAQWPDPHPDRSPLEEEYSRLLDPGKWRIIGARAEAWLIALADNGVAGVARDATVRWRVEPGPPITRVDLVTPLAMGALPMVVAHTRIDDVAGAGIVLGVGDPARSVTRLPDCGCDACDSGSQAELDVLDDHFVSIVSGAFRLLIDGDREITALSDDQWSASGQFSRREVPAILVDPTGWEEFVGTSWLAVA